MFCALKRYKAKERRWPRHKAKDKRKVVLADGKPVLRDLGKWMNRQKTRRDKLDPLREEMLNSIGFVWSEKEDNWKVWFDAVKSFKDKEGRWTRREKTEDKREVVLADGKAVLRDLATWMNTQKVDRGNGKLISFREEKLNSIGFVWDKREHEWHAMFDALIFFKEKEGRWPRNHKAEDKREVLLADGKPVLRDLASWMSEQKTVKSSGKLDALREEKLRNSGFPFDDRIKRKRQADPSGSITTTSRKKKRTISDNL